MPLDIPDRIPYEPAAVSLNAREVMECLPDREPYQNPMCWIPYVDHADLFYVANSSDLLAEMRRFNPDTKVLDLDGVQYVKARDCMLTACRTNDKEVDDLIKLYTDEKPGVFPECTMPGEDTPSHVIPVFETISAIRTMLIYVGIPIRGLRMRVKHPGSVAE